MSAEVTQLRLDLAARGARLDERERNLTAREAELTAQSDRLKTRENEVVNVRNELEAHRRAQLDISERSGSLSDGGSLHLLATHDF